MEPPRRIPLTASRIGLTAPLLWAAVVLLWGIDVGGAAVPLFLSRAAVVLALAATIAWMVRWVTGCFAGKRGRALAVAAILPALLLLSLAVRCVGLSHEVEGRYYLDEGTYYHHASEINAGRMLRLSFVYPHLMYYLDAVTLWMASLFPGAVKAWAGAVGVEDPLGVSWLLLRGVVALLSALTVIPVFRIAERLRGTPAGAVAGLLVIASPLYNDGSHLNICDVPSAFFATLCLLFVARLVEEERTRDYLLAGLCAGLAAAAKYPAGVVAVAIIAVWTFWRITRRDLRFGLLWAGLTALAAFLAVMPSLLVFPEAAFLGGRGIFFGARQYGKGGWLGVTPDSNAWFYAKALLESFGWPAALTGLSGLAVLATGTRKRSVLWMLPFPAAYLALIISMSMVVKRNLYPVVPILAVLLGAGIAVWLGRLARARSTGRVGPVLAAVLLAACLVLPVWWTGVQAAALARPTTREIAGDWIFAHVPRGASIAKESYTPDFPEGTYQVFHSRFVTRLTLEELARFDYVLVANAAYGRFTDPAALKPHQRAMAERYAEIFCSWELVHEWTPTTTQWGPVIRLYRAPRPR